MEQAFAVVTGYAVLLIDAIALIAIVYGTIEAFLGALRTMLVPSGATEGRVVWLRYARWLVAGLTFQLAADIIETSIAPGWDDIGRLAAIAVIRTFLNYFLERDLVEVRESQPT
ncbi:DUF1622 domain-containing protein [Mesorhizobium sp. M6A.T.Ce.TU.002.03.1.1]|uniref:DUF1622 domain-containing protein n=1 Tax=Mesorhizobium sp. M6A.T.Ce.TU.002.03.1.1 TaxID=2496782 RepID=UPI000FCCB03E|nr:DUF1622 domain-containing protein [Mesorhizobium sp. M6A.T.Ce.TU.002.03.1.1]RUU44596.1 DUF1622 domain-containing protein [Mesorhizobium sp. M6A.T.Ce.TU.002.03.1.1]